MADETHTPRPRPSRPRRSDPNKLATTWPGPAVALLVILLTTAPLLALLYLGAKALRLPFVPFDLYDWPVRAGFAPWASLADTLSIPTTEAANQAQNAPVVQWLLGLALFLAVTVGVGLAFYAFARRRGRAPDTIDGVIAGALVAVPMIFVALAVDSSPLAAPLVVVWLAMLFIGWGVLLSYAFARLVHPAAPALAADEVTEEPATGIDRRRFLLQFGASTAAVATVTAAAGAALARRQDTVALQRTLPMIAPEFRAAQSELFGQFRRFAIVRGGSAAVDTSNVLALGAEYPDRNYVSIWLGGHSPIVIYNSLETALAAYSTDDEPAGLFWLDA
jgi:hypothetical protein